MKVSLLFFIVILFPFAYAGEKSKYDFSWLDQDKEVYVLQNRKFRKDGNFHVSVLGGMTTSGAFTSANFVQGRLGYFFAEEWGVELLYSKNFSSENDTARAVYASSQVDAFVRKAQNYYGGMMLWSPFYAKINTFNKIVYFDWIFGAGAASFTDENNSNKINTTSNSNLPIEETNTGFMWEAGMRFYLSEMWSLRLNMTTVHYQATRAGRNSASEKTWFDNYDLGAGINFTF